MDPEIDFSLFFEKSLDLLVVAGFDGHFKRLNQTWVSTFGWTIEEFLSRPSLDFVHPDDRAATFSARGVLKTGGPWGGLINRYQCKDGTYRWLEWKSIAQPDRQLVYGVARDITEKRRAEQDKEQAQAELIFAERMASVGRLADGMAHEINNPLSSIIANLDFIGSELEPANPHKELVMEALTGAGRIKKIVQRLQAFSGERAEQRELIDLRKVLELALSMITADPRFRVRVVEDYGQTPLIEADAARLGQVFHNLLVNAMQAMGGTSADQNELRIVTSTNADGAAQVEVHDTGSGISEDVRAHIFDPFFTTKRPGSSAGLGLSMCQTIVTALGGTIAVVSHEGRGATLRVTLPAAG